MLERSLWGVALCALPLSAVAQEVEAPGPQVLLDELAGDRDRLLEAAPKEVRTKLEDAERILATQGERGWDFLGALATIRAQRHVAAVPLLLIKLHELREKSSQVGRGILRTLEVLTGDSFPARQTEETFVVLTETWWRVRRDELSVDVAELDATRRERVLRALFGLCNADARASTNGGERDVHQAYYAMERLLSRSSESRRWSADEIPAEFVPDLIELLNDPKDMWDSLHLLRGVREEGRPPQLAELRDDPRAAVRLAAELLSWAGGEVPQVKTLLALIDDPGASLDTRVHALLAAARAGGSDTDARILEILEGNEPTLYEAALRAATTRKALGFVKAITTRLEQDPASEGNALCYAALREIGGTEAEACLVRCVEVVLNDFTDDGPPGLFARVGSSLARVIGQRGGSYDRRANLEALLQRWRQTNPERTLEEWLADLASDNRQIRSAAVRGLSLLGAAAVPAAIDALSHDDVAVRACGAQVCEALGYKALAAAPALVSALGERAVSEPASKALRAMGGAATPALEQGLRDASPEVRRQVVDLLIRLGPEAQAPLERALDDDDDNVRARAAIGLGRFGEPSRGALEDALKDEVVGVRIAAADSLAKLPPGSAAALEKCLADPSDQVQAVVAVALARCGDDGVTTLSEFLTKQDEATPFHSSPIVRKIYRELGAAAVPHLLKASRARSASIRTWATTVLGELGVSEAIAPLTRVLHKDRDAAVRGEALRRITRLARSLAEAGEDLAPIRAALERTAKRDKDESLREQAERGLATLDSFEELGRR